MAHATKIYKICSQPEWQAAEENGVYTGSEVDVADGYIHFSTADQAQETAQKYFKNQGNLVLVEVDLEQASLDIRWEPSRGGDLFPHLYADLPISTASRVLDLPLDAEGVPVVPKEITN